MVINLQSAFCNPAESQAVMCAFLEDDSFFIFY